MSEIVLCGRPNKCCPKFGKNKLRQNYYLKSDDGEKVILNREQLEILKKIIDKELNSDGKKKSE